MERNQSKMKLKLHNNRNHAHSQNIQISILIKDFTSKEKKTTTFHYNILEKIYLICYFFRITLNSF